jgi:hypothetical protein
MHKCIRTCFQQLQILINTFLWPYTWWPRIMNKFIWTCFWPLLKFKNNFLWPCSWWPRSMRKCIITSFKPLITLALDTTHGVPSFWRCCSIHRICWRHHLKKRNITPRITKQLVQLSPDRMGPLGKPPASLDNGVDVGTPLLPSRAISRTCSPTLLTPQCQYEAIRVWWYTTFIVHDPAINRKLAVET